MRRWLLAIAIVISTLPAATLHEHRTAIFEGEPTSRPLADDHRWKTLAAGFGTLDRLTVDGLEWASERSWATRLSEDSFEAAERVASYARLQEEAAPQPPEKIVYVSSRFGPRYHPILKRWRPHNGIDFAASRGTPILAVANGRVRTAGWLGAAGRAVVLEHDGFTSHYAHMSRIARGLRSDDTVEEGEVIGYVGASGRATGHHLHFGIKVEGEWVDPLHDGLVRIEPLEDAALAVSMERGFLDGLDELQTTARSAVDALGSRDFVHDDDGDPFL